MKRLIAFASPLLVTFAVAAGCSDKASSTTTVKKEGPGGTTKVEEKETVKQTGQNPPAP